MPKYQKITIFLAVVLFIIVASFLFTNQGLFKQVQGFRI